MRNLACTLGLTVLAALTGCRGEISDKPPIHLVMDMDFQAKLKAQSESEFANWTDHRGMRLPVEETVARGTLGADDPDPEVAKMHTYKDAKGNYLEQNPMPLTLANLRRGQERYNIHCSVCHGRTGRGNGMVGQQMIIKPPSFMSAKLGVERVDERVFGLNDGELFDVITNGRSTMYPYGPQVDVEDRWAIIHFIRALQHRARD